MPRWNKAKVIEIHDWTEEHRQIFLQADPSGSFPFVAGRFVTFDLPIGEKRLDRWRSYSIANCLDNNIIELCIVKVPDGRASQYLFHDISIGDEFTFKGPSGAFVLPTDEQAELVFICTGTGVAPFRSMITSIFSSGLQYPKVHLVFGTKNQKSILYKEEFEQLAVAHDRFDYHIALSRESYNGYQGYVHNVYEQIEGLNRDKVIYMLCGWQHMIDEAVERLTQKMKIDRSKIIYELYG